MEYKRRKLRELIKSLIPQELDEALDDFQQVREQFTDGQLKYVRENIILDYFEKHQEEFPKFLEAIEKNNNTAYSSYRKYIEEPFSAILKAEANNLNSELIDRLIDIFPQQDELFWRCAKWAYQDFVFQRGEELDLEDDLDNVSELLLCELKIQSEKEIILEFFPRLAAYLLVKSIKEYTNFVQNLKQRIKENIDSSQVIRFEEFQKAINNFKLEYQQSSNRSAYLIIEIKENKCYPGLFQISGWLTTDEMIREKKLIPLNKHLRLETGHDKKEEQRYTQDNLKEIVREFINKQIPDSKIKFKELIIEFFLPSSLFGWDVDKWELETSISLGVVHEVRIRSLDRITLRNEVLYGKKWKHKWGIVQKCKNPTGKFFLGHCNCNLDTLISKLKDKEILGLTLSSALKSGHESIASALYYSGTPIALWLRAEPPEGDVETQLNNLLQESLLELPYRVSRERGQPECHISLIWDDPNRIIPNYQLQ